MNIDVFLTRLIRMYFLAMPGIGKYKPMLSFAWEKNYDVMVPNEHVQKIQETIQDSSALVIIGYSFPVFNRNADRAILGSFANRQIYIQDTDPDRVARSIASVLNPTPPHKLFIERIKIDVGVPDKPKRPDQFFPPPEL